MAGAWQEHGRSMRAAWQEHARRMAGAWQAHGRRMAGHGRRSDSIAQGIENRRAGLLGDQILLPWASEKAEPGK